MNVLFVQPEDAVVTGLNDPLQVPPEGAELLVSTGHDLPNSSVASQHRLLGPLGRRDRLGGGMDVLQLRVHPATVVCGEGILRELGVFLRHRLPLEPEVSEGAVAVPVGDQSDHFPIADVEEGGCGHPHVAYL